MRHEPEAQLQSEVESEFQLQRKVEALYAALERIAGSDKTTHPDSLRTIAALAIGGEHGARPTNQKAVEDLGALSNSLGDALGSVEGMERPVRDAFFPQAKSLLKELSEAADDLLGRARFQEEMRGGDAEFRPGEPRSA